jgi:cytochrome c oxidase cbb3-type subunit 3
MRHAIGCSILVLALLFVAADACSQASAVPGADSTLKLCKEMYTKDCSGCHGDKGQGTVGPNLADKYWLHGGGTANVTRTIREGVLGKGMISWDGVLTPVEIRQMSDYILTFQGTTHPRAKKAEGEPFEGGKN